MDTLTNKYFGYSHLIHCTGQEKHIWSPEILTFSFLYIVLAVIKVVIFCRLLILN